MDQSFIDLLFETEALQMAPEDRPFWYTSGTFGPFYINTHYLYGSKEEAKDLLSLIEREIGSPDTFYDRVSQAVAEQLERQPIYRTAIETAARLLESAIDIGALDAISGGERRDFFFSVPLALRWNKPHITLRKDGTCHRHEKGCAAVDEPDLKGLDILHVADIITLASSWVRQWDPAIRRCGGRLHFGFAMLDRCQGGTDRLKALGIEPHVIERTDRDFFDRAVRAGKIAPAQARAALTFLEDPSRFESDFLAAHPSFLQREIEGGGKNAQRAKAYLERNEHNAR